MFRAHEQVFTWRAERARLEPTVDHHRGSVRFSLIPLPGAAPLSAAFVTRCIEHARQQGGTEIVTPAVTARESAGIRDAGFRERAALHLLVHDLLDIPEASGSSGRSKSALRAGHRRAASADDEIILQIDRAAFGPDWCLDSGGLQEAVKATPRVRIRMADDPVAGSLGFAITGRSGRRGYLQRLAVDPNAQRGGVGRSLVVDALRWNKRWRVARVVVNTQIGNHAAYELYRRLGFVDAAIGLYVLHLLLLEPLAQPDSDGPEATTRVL